jgi:3-hexulose-6-phosphate synthase/6-phospho-3-hexuloisomerase
MKPIVQVSLDVTTIDEALEIAHGAVRAGVDWLEAGTPLILAEGLHGVKALRKEFPDRTIVADLKTMDGGGLETEMMAKAGASIVVVMAVAHPATVKEAVKVGKKYGVKVMGDILTAPDKVKAAVELEKMGVDYIVVHTGFDERHYIKGASPLDDLPQVLEAVSIPVQAVGGLSIEDAIKAVEMGSELFVIGAPLVISNEKFEVADGRFEQVLKEIVDRVKAVSPKKRSKR